jgi:hypothetical protein
MGLLKMLFGMARQINLNLKTVIIGLFVRPQQVYIVVYACL